jgi:hypothetical protein
MEMVGRPLDGGGMEFTIRMDADEWRNHQKQIKEHNSKIEESASDTHALAFPWERVKYCVTCSADRSRHTIEAYGDIAANAEAASTCLTRTGDPSYSMHDGDC